MKFYIATLGCKVNTYESNYINDELVNNGYIAASKMEDADICIVNTCTVTNTSDNKSLKVIRQIRRNNPKCILIVMGCMIQVYKDIESIDADIIIGNTYKNKIVDLINEFKENKKKIIRINDLSSSTFETMVLNNFLHVRAFVKIEDGCENFCSYCIIPYARGPVRSKDKDLIIDEIKTLIKKGHEEIVLTGIHTGHYGSDLKDYNFAKLLSEIVKIDGLKRLRISSIEITEITDEVMDIIRNNPVIVDHMHIPLQSGSNTILKLMNRKYDKEYFIDKINQLRAIRPDISITTDIIVGFPGETDELFKETLETVDKIKFSKIHVFPFSLRNGTKAEELPNHIDQVTKKNRVRKLIDISTNLEIEYAKKFIGKKVTYIPETYKDGYLYGHTGNYLYIKEKGDRCDLYTEKEKIIEDVDYPYCI
ncbi:MAG: tRNA (N(6)-L-threonylcarbamoyladenosine(37)-C(2))-methylthiotransferase MtaB [Bacilli bacterium]|nr:tRNA (N(6)-L-threonylcarbamoyladenosine(37)-C(2))-methylthiotransferase MtaB [Bacilli bacterium]